MSETATALQVRIPKAELTAINALVEESQLAIAAAGEFDRAFTMAAALRQIGELITKPMMEDIMQLQGKSLGFRTDRDDKPPYGADVVKDCLIEAVLWGARPVGNEFNIISSKPYFTKEYYVRRVRDCEDITDLHATPGEVEVKGGLAYVDYVAAWQLRGEPTRLEKIRKTLAGGTPFDDRIVVRVNKDMVYDALIGKAKRRMYREILQLSTEATFVPTDGDVDDALDVASAPVTAQPSTLFNDAPLDDGPSNDQDALMAEYEKKLADCQSKPDVGRVAKQSGGDGRLKDGTRGDIAKLCTARRQEV